LPPPSVCFYRSDDTTTILTPGDIDREKSHNFCLGRGANVERLVSEKLKGISKYQAEKNIQEENSDVYKLMMMDVNLAYASDLNEPIIGFGIANGVCILNEYGSMTENSIDVLYKIISSCKLKNNDASIVKECIADANHKVASYSKNKND
jgi:hypothetical protein